MKKKDWFVLWLFLVITGLVQYGQLVLSWILIHIGFREKGEEMYWRVIEDDQLW